MGGAISILYISPIDFHFRPSLKQMIEIVKFLQKEKWFGSRWIFRPIVGTTSYASFIIDGRDDYANDIEELIQIIKKSYEKSKTFVLGTGMTSKEIEKQLEQLYKEGLTSNICESWGLIVKKKMEIIATSDEDIRQKTFSFYFAIYYHNEIMFHPDLKKKLSLIKDVPIIKSLIDGFTDILDKRIGLFYTGSSYLEKWGEKNPIEYEKGDYR